MQLVGDEPANGRLARAHETDECDVDDAPVALHGHGLAEWEALRTLQIASATSRVLARRFGVPRLRGPDKAAPPGKQPEGWTPNGGVRCAGRSSLRLDAYSRAAWRNAWRLAVVTPGGTPPPHERMSRNGSFAS